MPSRSHSVFQSVPFKNCGLIYVCCGRSIHAVVALFQYGKRDYFKGSSALFPRSTIHSNFSKLPNSYWRAVFNRFAGFGCSVSRNLRRKVFQGKLGALALCSTFVNSHFLKLTGKYRWLYSVGLLLGCSVPKRWI